MLEKNSEVGKLIDFCGLKSRHDACDWPLVNQLPLLSSVKTRSLKITMNILSDKLSKEFWIKFHKMHIIINY